MSGVLTPTELAQGQLEAYNQRDIDSFVKVFADNVECFSMSDPSAPRVKGAVQFRDTYSKLFGTCPNLHCKILSRVAVGNFVLDHEEVTGLPGVDGPFHIAAIYQIENGLIRRVYFTR